MDFAISSPSTLRSAEILGRVRGAFAEKGFDGASMQDLAKAAGMSVGNFYRYFPSKSAIVEALISLDLAEMEADFTLVRQASNPMLALRQMMIARLSQAETEKDGQLWAEITAASLRKPEISTAACAMESKIATFLNETFATETGLSPDEIASRFPAHAAFVITLFKAAAMLPPTSLHLKDHLLALIQRSIDSTLGEISAAKKI